MKPSFEECVEGIGDICEHDISQYKITRVKRAIEQLKDLGRRTKSEEQRLAVENQLIRIENKIREYGLQMF